MVRPATAWSLRVYFALLFALVVGGSVAGAFYVDHATSADARRAAQRDASFSAKTAAEQLENHVAQLKATAAQLAANPQIAQVFDNPAGCTLSFQGMGGPDKGHVDIIAADGKVACSSRALKDDPRGAGYAKSAWLAGALTRTTFIGPVRDDIVGGQVVIASSPIAGGKGVVATFADLAALGPHLAKLYGGGRHNEFLVTTADNRTVVARSDRPARSIGTHLAPGEVRPKPGAEWRDLDGVNRLYVHAAMPKAGWNIYVGENESTVLASVKQLRTRQLELIGIGLLILLLAVALIYRNVASPIRRFSAAVREATRRHEPVPVPISGPTELRALAEDVNVLAASVHAELAERRRAEASAKTSEES